MKDARFFQPGPQLSNAFSTSFFLSMTLESFVPEDIFRDWQPRLTAFADRVLEQAHPQGRLAETHPPVHVPFDAWGNRIDLIQTHPAWQELKNFSARESLVAHGYKRPYGSFSRLFQMSQLFLFHPSSAFFSCPLAMTDGAAKVLEPLIKTSPLFQSAFEHLISTDEKMFWTSGQWMTEKTGGSDVSDTSTRATPHKDHYHLTGVKWFSSSTTSEMALALARIDGAEPGSRGLSLFYVPTYKKTGQLNNIQILRLKDKLGTKALPTAELELHETKGHLIGEPGQGIKTVAAMLNTTRLYNAVCSVAQSERILLLLRDYATKREVFKKTLAQQPLFKKIWTQMLSQHWAGLSLTFEVARLMGREEASQNNPIESQLFRLLTPLAKLYTAKQAVAIASEALEGFGGAGYIENTEISVLFRDAQVFPIWEGATNVLSLDMLRVLKSPDILSALCQHFRDTIAESPSAFPDVQSKVDHALKQLQLKGGAVLNLASEMRDQESRDLAFAICHVFASALMLRTLQARPQNRNCLPWLEYHVSTTKLLPLFHWGE